MYGITAVSAYVFAVCACFWSCANLAGWVASTVAPRIAAASASTDRPLSRVEKRLQDQAAVVEPAPVRPPVRAMAPPELPAAQLAVAMDRAEMARLVRSLPISDLRVETMPAIAVAAARPDREIVATALATKTRKTRSPSYRDGANRNWEYTRADSRTQTGPPASMQKRGADFDRDQGAKQRMPGASVAGAPWAPLKATGRSLSAITPGALMFAGFIERES